MTLNHDDLLKVRAAAISARLSGSRTALLAGLSAEFVASLPHAAGPGEQVLCDLDALNAAGVLADGSEPLAIWLANAAALTGSRVERAVFEQGLGVAESTSVIKVLPIAAPEVEDDRAAVAPTLNVDNVAIGIEPKKPEPDDPALEKQGSYARAWLPSALFMLPVVITVATLFASGATNRAAPWKIAQNWIDFGQLVTVVSVFIWEWIHRTKDPDHRNARDKELVEPFARHWNWIWRSWCFFYLVHTVRGFYEYNKFGDEGPPRDWIQVMNIATNLLFNLQCALLFILFWMMIRPNWDKKDFLFGLDSWGVPAGVWCIGFSVVHVLLWIAFRGSGNFQYFMWDLVASFLAGVSAATFMGMFIGRLESAFLDVHPVELAVLYVYAGIQPFFRVLGSLRVIPPSSTADFIQPFTLPFFELSLKALAGALKLGLYFVVRRQFTSGRLVFYMREQRALRAKVKEDWKRFKGGE